MTTPTRQFISAAEARAPYFVGIDLGGTTVKLGVLDDLGRPLCRHSLPTHVERGPENGACRMGRAVREAIAALGLDAAAVARVGLGSPGILDVRGGVMVNPTNFPRWGGFPLRDRVSHHCGLPVAFVNDANAAAYGEFWVGSGRSFRSLILLTLGTGVGCGIIIGDVIVEGENGHGAECGHVLIDPSPSGRRCSCGMTGHLEAYASATAVIQRTGEALELGRPSTLGKRLADGSELTPRMVAEEAEAGDALSMRIVLQTARYLGIGIVSVLHTIDPACVLLGGAMTFGGRQSELGRRFLRAVCHHVKRRTFPTLAARLQIDFATLGTDAGYIGAAGIARLEHHKSLRKPAVWP
jgi:glucokinase